MTNRTSAGPARLAFLHFRIGALNEMQYRANFFIQVINSLIALGTGLVAIALVYGHTSDLGGWSQPELLAVMGVHILVGGLMRTFVQPNMNRLMEDVMQGTLDYALTRPADSQLLVSVREISIWQLLDVIVGGVVVVWSVIEVSGRVGLAATLGFVVAIGCGATIIYSIWLIATTSAFKVVRIDNLVQLLNGIYEAGRWPVTVYPGWLRGTLTFVIPLAFAVTVPAEMISRRIGVIEIGWALLVTAAFVTLARIVWRWGIKNYSGASA